MKKGFTLIELVVVMGILLVIGAVVVVSLAGRRTDTDIVAVTVEIATTLRQAQADSIAVEGGQPWGVRFANSATGTPSYALFTGASYASGTVKGYYRLPNTVAYVTSTLASGATLDVIFSPVTGASSVSTSVKFYMPAESTAYSSTISISPAGVVSY